MMKRKILIGDAEAIAMVLHVRHAYIRSVVATSNGRRTGSRTHRMLEAVEPLADGPIEVINEAFDFRLFSDRVPKVPSSVMIFGQKNPRLAAALTAALEPSGAGERRAC